MAQVEETSNNNKSKKVTGFFNTDMRSVHQFIDDINISDVMYHAHPCRINGTNLINRSKIYDTDRMYAESVENKDAIYFKMEIPGIGKEDVSVTVENKHMTIKAGNETGNYRFESTFCPIRVYKVHDTRVVVKNGVLTVMVPKDENKQEKNMDVFQVQVN